MKRHSPKTRLIIKPALLNIINIGTNSHRKIWKISLSSKRLFNGPNKKVGPRESKREEPNQPES